MILSAPFRLASRFFLYWVVFSICLTVVGSIGVCAAEAASIHADFANVPDGIVDRSELLLGKLNCIACHQADPTTKARVASKQSRILGQEAITPQYLRKFLADPQSAKSGSTMPDLLHGMEAADRTAAVDALVHFLVSTMSVSNSPAVAADEFKIQQGRLLYHQVGCVACHAPQEPASILQSKAVAEATAKPPVDFETLQRESVPLGDLARKTTLESLARFLKDPLRVRPSGRMPSMNLTDAEANAIAMYLLRAQTSVPRGNGPRPKTQGLAFQYFEGNFEQTTDLDKQKAKSSGLIERFGVGDRKNKQHFGLRLTGVLTIPADGNYTFYTESDDGSRLFVDGTIVVQNDGIHGPTEQKGSIDLKAGEHPILVTYFNGGSGASLKVSYSGPGITKREIPSSALFTYGGQPMVPLDNEQFVADSVKATRGKQLFTSLGCVACHAMNGINAAGAPKAKEFASMSANGGCLGENPAKGVPKYAFSSSQRAAIAQTLARRADLAKPLDPVGQVNHTMAELNCFACHSREGIGGPSAERAEYFSVVGEADLGDEGRIPPHLTRVGDKLRSEWIREVLVNKGFVRPYMATRMPQFGERNVGHLPKAFEQADSGPVAPAVNDTSPADVKFGRNLVGTGGFSCISCHTFGPHKSLGIPAMDLTQMSKRLKQDWFHRYLLDPQSLRPGTRMPTFWPEGKSSRSDILGGNTDRQINAIWAFLSRAKDGGLPPGLVQGKMEIVATTEAVIYRHFIDGAGSRAIGVGYPEKANLAFDANNLRLAEIWQGSFIDAAIHRIGRGAGSAPPLGYDVVRMPQGSAFARLESVNEKWPEETGKKAGYQMRGYSLDEKRRPTFRYSFQNLAIEDAPIAVPGEVDPFFRRTVTVKAERAPDNLWFRAWSGSKVEEQGGGVFLADGKVKLRFELPGGPRPVLRQSGGATELLVPVPFAGKEARFVEEITW